jgi:hypothetical protein
VVQLDVCDCIDARQRQWHNFDVREQMVQIGVLRPGTDMRQWELKLVPDRLTGSTSSVSSREQEKDSEVDLGV